MKSGILKKHRNKLYEILKSSGIDTELIDSEYNVSDNYFQVFLRDCDFGFYIARSEDDINYFDEVLGDTHNDKEGISTHANFETVCILFRSWLDDYAKEYIKIINEDDELVDLWELEHDPNGFRYQEEFFTEFQIIDDNADKEPFSINQQLYLDSYLQDIIDRIDDFKTPENKPKIEEIKADTNQLKDEASRLTKTQTIKRLSSIWAKMRKTGISILKEFLIVGKQEIISAIVKGIISG